MINNVTAVTNIGYAGLVDAYSKRINRAEGERPETTDARVQKSSEEERKRVVPTYGVQGEIIEPHEEGKRLDIILEFYEKELQDKDERQLDILA